jgi:SpoVK/Ycf46/Vps4 family AAA+-type ATPase
MVALRLVLQRRPLPFGSDIFAGVEIDLEDMVVGVAEAIGTAMAEIAFAPADPRPHRLDRGDAAQKRRLARGAIADMADAGGVRGGELQRVEFVIVPGAQIDGIALAPALRQAEDVDEEVEARLGLVREELDMAEMGNVEAGLGIHSQNPLEP